MSDISRFRALSPRERAIVAIAVLVDGHDAPELLSADKERRTPLSRAAKDLVSLPPDLRLPLVGTLLRDAVQLVEKGESNSVSEGDARKGGTRRGED